MSPQPKVHCWTFGIRHITNTAGLKKVNQSITYTDNEGNVVIFPDPSVMVDCDIVIYPEECPEPVDLSVDNCRDASIVDLGETYMESLGRIVEVSATIEKYLSWQTCRGCLHPDRNR